MYEVSIVMPCYKGENFIEQSIHTVENIVSNFLKSFEIIVVIDGFVDKSYEVAKRLENIYNNLKVIGYEKNRGKGFAVKYALKFISGKYVVLLDSDLDYNPKVIKNFLKISQEENADIVIGNRRDKRSVSKYSKLREFLSKGFNIYVNVLFPKLRLHDTQAGIKLFKRDVLEKLFDYVRICNGYAFDVCLLVSARKLGYKIVEAPCIFVQNHTEIRNTNLLKTMYRMGIDVLKLRLGFR